MAQAEAAESTGPAKGTVSTGVGPAPLSPNTGYSGWSGGDGCETSVSRG